MCTPTKTYTSLGHKHFVALLVDSDLDGLLSLSFSFLLYFFPPLPLLSFFLPSPSHSPRPPSSFLPSLPLPLPSSVRIRARHARPRQKCQSGDMRRKRETTCLCINNGKGKPSLPPSLPPMRTPPWCKLVSTSTSPRPQLCLHTQAPPHL